MSVIFRVRWDLRPFGLTFVPLHIAPSYRQDGFPHPLCERATRVDVTKLRCSHVSFNLLQQPRVGRFDIV